MQVPGHDPRRDVLLGLVAATDEPMAGGRHKVFGHHDLAIIPQTSTIASHLPRALGVAFSIDRAAAPRRAVGLAGGRHRGVQLRRRLGQPLHGDRRHQHGVPHRSPAPAPAAAVRVRGQRPRHQRAHAARVDRGRLRAPAAPALVRGRRHRPGRHVRRRVGRGGLGALRAGAGLPPPAHRPLHGPRRARTWRRRTAARPRSATTTPATPSSARLRCVCESGVATPHGPRPPLRADPRRGAGPGRGVRDAPPADHARTRSWRRWRPGTRTRSGRGRDGGTDRAPPRRSSTAACPRTRARSRWPSRSTARCSTCWPATPSCSCSARTWRPRAACTASPGGS